MGKFKRHLYTTERIIFDGKAHRCIESDDGTLFAGRYRTKLYEYDLPEWYLQGCYYKLRGYLSTKGIVDMLYIPNMHINHFLKDDCLLVSYDRKIRENPEGHRWLYEKYIGWDERIFGSEILGVLKGAQKYSDYDISAIIDQIKEKQKVFKEKHPSDYEIECDNFDVDAYFAKDFESGHPPKFYALTLNDYFSPSFVSGYKQYYGTIDTIREFIDMLNADRFHDTISAFQNYMNGNKEATHYVAYSQQKLLRPVKLIKKSFLYIEGSAQWDFMNLWGFTYSMKYNMASAVTALIQDGDKFIRCIKPTIRRLSYKDDICSSGWLPITQFWGHPGLLTYKNDWKGHPVIEGNLYFPERVYEDVKTAIREFNSEPLDLNIVCEDIFADG